MGQQPAPEKQPGLEQAGVLETTSSLLGQEVVCQNAGRLVGGGQEEGAASRLFARRSDKKCNFFGRSSAHQRPPQKPVGPAEGGYRGSKGQLLFLKKKTVTFFSEIKDFARDILLILAKPAKRKEKGNNLKRATKNKEKVISESKRSRYNRSEV